MHVNCESSSSSGDLSRGHTPETQAPRASSWRAALLVFGICCVVYGFGLGSFGLIARGEPRYATVAREMLHTGDFITPRINGMVYLDKPPLLHWMDAASMGLLGETEGAFRLPTMLLAALCTALLYALARLVMGQRVALCSAAVLTSSVLWFCMARHARFDLPLATMVSVALCCCWWAAEGGVERRWWYLGAAAAMGLGMLTKGPIALVLTGVPFLLYMGLTGRLAALKHVPWIACVTLLLAIAAPWYVACERANPGYLRFFFGHENAWRLTREVPVRQPWWHTVAFLLGGLSPWGLCVPGALRRAWRSVRYEGGAEARLLLLSCLLVGVVIAVYLPPPVKFVQYIIPALPAMALLIGRYLGAPNNEGRVGLYATAGLVLLTAVAVAVTGHRLLPLIGLPSATLVPVWVGCLLASGVVAVLATRARRPEGAVIAIAAALLLPLHVSYRYVGSVAPYVLTEKPVIQAAARHAAPGQALLCYGYTPPSARYYYPYGIVSVGDPVDEYDYPGNAGHTGTRWYPLAQEARVLAAAPSMIGLAKRADWQALQQRHSQNVRLLEDCPPYVIFETIPTPVLPAGTHP
jgi:4-amino-4-deoxy-L-arabinose transferase-like glycosyltransferase